MEEIGGESEGPAIEIRRNPRLIPSGGCVPAKTWGFMGENGGFASSLTAIQPDGTSQATFKNRVSCAILKVEFN